MQFSMGTERYTTINPSFIREVIWWNNKRALDSYTSSIVQSPVHSTLHSKRSSRSLSIESCIALGFSLFGTCNHLYECMVFPLVGVQRGTRMIKHSVWAVGVQPPVYLIELIHKQLQLSKG